MTAPPAIAAVIRRREREVVDDFRRGGATDPTSAKSLADLGLEDSWPVRRLQRRAVIREPQPGIMYLDEEVWAAVLRTRRRVALTTTAVLVVIIIAVWMGFVTFT
ncbi:MAG TPA: hypothetical protein VES88_17750 [Gemmatimonadaceae bacterium]|nr:hypothetical protein [Gemmatimonadaceae bacterium]